MTGESINGVEFEVMQQVAELIDTLKPEQQSQVIAMLFARYQLKIVRLASSSGRSYHSTRRSKPKRW